MLFTSDEWKFLDTQSPGRSKAFPARLLQMAAESGRSRYDLIKEITTLNLGAGRLSFDEYDTLRLYDNTLYGGVDKKAFIGLKTMQKIWVRANYRFDLFGLMNSKIAADILLSAYGFPTLPTIALFREHIGQPSPLLLRDEGALRRFLMTPEYYPLFGKPANGQRSIGTASLERYDTARGTLITTMGHGITLDMFMSYVKAHADAGYLFQRRVAPHAQVKKICGERLATVRLLTIVTQRAPKILHACWKIPAGVNIADNFWRSGNLLARLDEESGRVLCVIRKQVHGFESITHHPDTGAPLLGICVPHWQEITRLAMESAKVMEEMALAGWDIAPVDSGAVIVEVNETPDFNIHQLADQRGVLDAELFRFLEERKRHAASWLRETRQKRRMVTELVAP